MIEYRDDVAGRTWIGDRIAIADGIDSESRALAESVTKRYAMGSSVTVYYCPDDESLAVLEPGVSGGAVAQSVIGGAFSLMVGGLWAFVLSRRGRQAIDALANPAHER